MENEDIKLKIMELREIMKMHSEDEDSISDQMAGLPQPPLSKPAKSSVIISLTKNFEDVIKNNDFLNLINRRTSKRKYSNESLSMEELAFLLWTTQGVKNIIGKQRKATMRTVPSAGARHPFETYLFVNLVEGLEPGIYHYLPLEHKLEFIKTIENQEDRLTKAYCGQSFLGNAAVDFVWTVIPYRSEWKYSITAQKYALVDVGHVCQNLYLACEAIDCGACAIGAYDQVLTDELLDLDSNPSNEMENEFVVYSASVGKVSKDLS